MAYGAFYKALAIYYRTFYVYAYNIYNGIYSAFKYFGGLPNIWAAILSANYPTISTYSA